MVTHPAVQSLVDEIEAFRSQKRMSATAFGVQALNDGRLVPDLVSGGRHPSDRTKDRIRAFIAAHQGIES
jgi:hypothetical protein